MKTTTVELFTKKGITTETLYDIVNAGVGLKNPMGQFVKEDFITFLDAFGNQYIRNIYDYEKINFIVDEYIPDSEDEVYNAYDEDLFSDIVESEAEVTEAK